MLSTQNSSPNMSAVNTPSNALSETSRMTRLHASGRSTTASSPRLGVRNRLPLRRSVPSPSSALIEHGTSPTSEQCARSSRRMEPRSPRFAGSVNGPLSWPIWTVHPSARSRMSERGSSPCNFVPLRSSTTSERNKCHCCGMSECRTDDTSLSTRRLAACGEIILNCSSIELSGFNSHGGRKGGDSGGAGTSKV